MTAQLLSSVASPLSRHFDLRPNTFRVSRSAYATNPPPSTASLVPIFLHDDYQLSSASSVSISSAPIQAHNENHDLPDVDILGPERFQPMFGHLSSNSFRVRPEAHGPISPTPVHSAKIHSGREPSERSHRARRALAELHNEQMQTPAVHSCMKAELDTTLKLNVDSFSDPESSKATVRDASDGRAMWEHRPYLSALYEIQPSAYRPETLFLDGSSDGVSETVDEPHSISHKKRDSTASSGHVHTMKTASLSNASFSIVPRSLRLGRSTDSSGFFGSHTRQSLESDRPPTSSSMDEAAFRRGIKRRQILRELITTEEGYVADLKALIYLYSTLLATTTAIPSPVRPSVLRNVHDLLHIHENLLDQLHQSAFDAAARKWADTTSPRHLGSPRQHRRWRSLESNGAVKLSRHHRRTRSSLDSSEATRGRTYLGCAEPRDVADVAAIFNGALNDFLVYEEYCANHSLIAHELQRHAPTLWSTYELGMESLARSLAALSHKRHNEKRGITVGDLLIKPIQRMTKYPLLFDDLLKQTPVADCPAAHTDVESTLQSLREVVQTVNRATDNLETRNQIQRRWSLQARLTYSKVSLKADQFRMLGNVNLCGVLHTTWQTRARIDGCYTLCILFDSSFVVALPAGASSRFEVVAFIHLSDIRVESASDGRGLQCHSTVHTWKICFEVSGHLHEFVLSACSMAEEHVWKDGLQRKGFPARMTDELFKQIPSSIGLDLRSIGMVYSQQSSTLSRNPSVQRAATVGNRAPVCQVIIRNTHNPQVLQEYRQQASASAINRSQSHMTSNRVVVLSPKRSERARLESTLSDVWTKEKLPYPGMIGSRGGQIIRASAGSLVRKLSLASIHAPFSRRSGSLSLTSRKSYDASSESRRSRTKHAAPVFEVRKESLDEVTPARKRSHDLPELDTMDSVVCRMIGNSGQKPTSFAKSDSTPVRRGTKSRTACQDPGTEVGPEDSAEMFYTEIKDIPEKQETVEEGLGGRKKRWSNPLGILKVLSADGFRHMMYSSK